MHNMGLTSVQIAQITNRSIAEIEALLEKEGLKEPSKAFLWVPFAWNVQDRRPKNQKSQGTQPRLQGRNKWLLFFPRAQFNA